MASGPRQRLTWRAEPPRGATRHKATWQSPGGPHGAQEAHRGVATWQEATQSRGPRGRPYGAPRGRLVSGGPTGIVGPG